MKLLTSAATGIMLLACAALQTAAAANIEHTVRQGDTLYHLSQVYGVPVGILKQVNDIPNARSLRVGSTIEIPQTYRVQKGDTLYSIAQDYGIPLSKLVSFNHISASHIIKIGEVLVLPPEASRTGSATGSQGAAPTTGAAGQDVSATSNGAPFWPASGKRIFLSGKLEGGTQISGQVGDPVYTVAGGRVVWVGPYQGYGRVVFVESQSGYIYVYGGNETTLVTVGETVGAGTQVANMGVNPHLGRACAYFFVYRNGKPVNPRTAPRG